MRFGRPTIASAVAVLGLSVVVVACGGNDDNNSGGGGAGGGGGQKIALLLPEHTTTRYETQDRPHFEAKVKELCLKHGFPYRQESVFKRFKRTIDVCVGNTRMRELEAFSF